MRPLHLVATVEFTKSLVPGRRRWTRLRPQYRSDGEKWVPIPSDRAPAVFPDEGLVFWWDSPRDAEQVYSAWVVSVEESSEGGGADKFKVLDGRRVVVLERIPAMDSSSFRRRCASGELELSRRPLGPVLAQLPGEDSKWVGPLEFDHSRPAGSFVGPVAIPTGFLDLHEIAEDSTQRFSLREGEIERAVQVLRPGYRTEETRVGYWAAQDDEHLLHGVLKRLQQLDKTAVTALQLTDRVAHAYSASLADLDLIGDDARREEARLQAALQLLKEAKLSHEQLDGFARALLSRRDVQERVDEAVRKQIKARSAEMEADFRSQEEERSAQVRELDRSIEESRSRLAEREKELVRMEEEAKKRLEDVARDVLRVPVESVAERMIVEALIAAGRDRSDHGSSSERDAARPPIGEAVSSVESLLGATTAGAMRTGFDAAASSAGIAAMLSRRPLLAYGSRSLEMCRLLGSVASAGLIWEVSVPAAIFGLDDLLNLPAIALEPEHQTVALGTLLTERGQAEHLATVIFRGLNRAPLEVAFEELLLPVGASPPPPLAWSHGAHGSAVTPPVRVHLLATLSSGPSCFPVPLELVDRLAVVDSGRRVHPTHVSDLPLPALHATPDQWSAISEAITSKGRELGVPLPYAEERGLLDEYYCYAGVFGDTVTAATQWLLSTRGRDLLRAAESDILGELPPDVSAAVKSNIEDGRLRRMTRYLAQG